MNAKDTIIDMLAHDFRGCPAINVRTDDFHALSSDQVQRLIDRANDYGYRAPKNASGSRARYFFYMLQRHASRTASAEHSADCLCSRCTGAIGGH